MNVLVVLLQKLLFPEIPPPPAVNLSHPLHSIMESDLQFLFLEPSSLIREKSPRPPQQETGCTVGHVDSQSDSDPVQTK